MRVEAFLLAAGESRRMGAPKPLLPFGSGTVLSTISSAFLLAGFESVTVIHRVADVALAEAALSLGLRLASNDDPTLGMSSSVAVAAAAASAEWIATCPCDMPLLTAETLARLVKALDQCAADALQPRTDGRRKHPVVMRRQWLTDCAPRLRSGSPLRELLAEAEVGVIECSDPLEFLDFDTPEEYEALVRIAQERGVQ